MLPALNAPTKGYMMHAGKTHVHLVPRVTPIIICGSFIGFCINRI